MYDFNLMTTEELEEHIVKCHAILESKRKDKVNRLVNNLTNAAQALFNECPAAMLKAEYYDEEREENVEVYIDLEHLTHKDNYDI